MSVTVITAAFARGYSGNDHLLDDGALYEIEGRSYASTANAFKAAYAHARNTQHHLCDGAPISMLLQMPDGSTVYRTK